MLNFIVAKALAKDTENRYQNAKDFAGDLRACLGAMARSSVALNVTKPVGTSSSPGVSLAGVSEEEGDSAVTMRLSPSFDSVGATMRLAAMTASPEDVEELSRTFKMARPSLEEINRAAPHSSFFSKSAPDKDAHAVSEDQSAKGGGLVLMVIVVTILAGLISLLLL
jgi:serine/threonine-protein kinase